MSHHGKLFGASIAAAVALAFVAAPHIRALADNREVVMCPGVNSCQGKSQCRVTTNSCKVISEKGQNACKGQGFLMLSKIECVKRGSRGIVFKVPSNAVSPDDSQNEIPVPNE